MPLKKINTENFNNPDYADCIKRVAKLSEKQINELLGLYPQSCIAFAALIELIHGQFSKTAIVDDWECDMADIVWPEVHAKLKK